MTFTCSVFTLPNSFIPLRITIFNFSLSNSMKPGTVAVYVVSQAPTILNNYLSPLFFCCDPQFISLRPWILKSYLYYKSDLENIYVQEMWENLKDRILSIILQIIISFKWETHKELKWEILASSHIILERGCLDMFFTLNCSLRAL